MAPVAKGREDQPSALRLLLACGAIGPLLFIVAFLIEGATRPGYNAWHHVVSSLSLGAQGWEQTANFLVSGALVFAFAFGLRRALHPGKGATWGPILLGVVGLCTLGAGLFAIDPVLGYPPGAPSTSTLHGTLHILLGNVSGVALIAACFVLARRFWSDPAWRGWAIYSIVAGVLFLVFLIIEDVVTSPDPNSPAGLFQRLSIIVGWTWIASVAIRLLTKKAPISR